MIAIAREFGLPVVVAINRFVDDTDAEVALVRKLALEAGASDAVLSNHFSEGGAGAVDLAKAVVAACEQTLAVQFPLSPGDGHQGQDRNHRA